MLAGVARIAERHGGRSLQQNVGTAHKNARSKHVARSKNVGGVRTGADILGRPAVSSWWNVPFSLPETRMASPAITVRKPRPVSRGVVLRIVAAVLVVAMSWSLGSGPATAAEARLPNIVFILADDLGYGDLHCYGHPYSKTPNLDKLAAEGTRFTQFYSTGVTCCPARTGLMTGKFPATFAKYPSAFGFGDRTTITELLKKQGYATGHFGKWHIGPTTTAGTYGIDVVGADDEAAPGGKKNRSPELGRDAPIYDAAIRFVEKHRDGPFYVNVWSHITHHPIDPSQKFVDEFRDLHVDEAKFSDYQREKFATIRKGGGDVDDAMRHFLGDLYSLDLDVGRLLAKLDELGLRENTIVVFNSDQGAAPVRLPGDKSEGTPKSKKAKKQGDDGREELRFNLVGDSGGLRGGKHIDYEGGVRTPFIVRWPGHVPAGRVDEASVLSGADWLPSLCAIAGARHGLTDLDGEDSSPAWLGGTHVRTKPLFWKTNSTNSGPAMRVENWKLRASHRNRGDTELFDLATDAAERKNLAAEKADVVATLKQRLDAWTASLPTAYEHGDARDD